MDMCGTCDADATNDCVQDCAGTWGGHATMDPCGTCDANPANDCTCDPCGACDTDPTNDCVPSCPFGERMLGGCWYVSRMDDNCITECATHGGYSEQTRRVAGSEGTAANCDAIAHAYVTSLTAVTTSYASSPGLGCAARDSAVFGVDDTLTWFGHAPTTGSAALSGYYRFCACNE
jgi:hypothetical protein